MPVLDFPTPPLADHSVLLRPWRAADVPAIARVLARPQAGGRGVGSSAVRLLARWGFTQLGLSRIELTCGPDNEAQCGGRDTLRVGRTPT